MGDVPDEKSLAASLAKLKANSDAMPWRDRRALAQSLADPLANGEPSDSVLSLLELLSDDPKWEVRGDVAELLLLVPDDRFAQLAAKLSEDPNSFVRKAAERALDRRRKGERDARRRRRGIDDLADDYATMETLHGTLAAQKARQIGERLYDVLVGATVHNMRRVLTSIKGNTSALVGQSADSRLGTKSARKHLSRIQDGVTFLERLLEDMREYSQPVPQERRRERLVDLIAEARRIVEDNFTDSGHDLEHVEVEISVPEVITLDVARHQLVVAFTNLLQNAFEAFVSILDSDRPCRVSVSAELTGDEKVQIVIEDNGVGFGAEDLKQIREFVPGQTTLKRDGTGFGLPTAKRYIEGHGGRIGIESREDEGTKVTITLPIEAEGEESGE